LFYIYSMQKAHINTPVGTCLIEGDENGVSKIWVLDDEAQPSPTIPEELLQAVTEIEEYFSGRRKDFTFKMNPQGTDFQKKVWHTLLEIPFGKTMSYHELAIKLGDVKAIRAVASANGKNPLWVAVPCHRVIGSDGSLTGYAGGLWRKKWLLEHETPPTQQSLF
jgi:methylated-DNA-[protein]-cysteine S-methyltransferase